MFYSHFVLSKKGPLARIWLAAHWDKKLTKAAVFETNIDNSVEAILRPKVKLALRTSGHLLLGVVRIYSRKAKYLLADCNEAFVKIKMAFRPGIVDLSEDNREAAISSITLPETFNDFETTLADLDNVDMQVHFNVNQSRPEEITMKEDFGHVAFISDMEGFGDCGDPVAQEKSVQNFFESMRRSGQPDGRSRVSNDSQLSVMRDASSLQQSDTSVLRQSDSSALRQMDSSVLRPGDSSVLHAGDLSSFMDADKTVTLDVSLSHINPADDIGVSLVDADLHDDLPYIDPGDSDNDVLDDFGGEMDHNLFENDFSSGLPELPSVVPEPTLPGAGYHPGISRMYTPIASDVSVANESNNSRVAPGDLYSTFMTNSTNLSANQTSGMDQTTVLASERSAFVLEPLDSVTVQGGERKAKRKRRLVVDEQKAISSESMKLQLSDTSDIVVSPDLAPPNKVILLWKETGGVEKLFIFPSRPIASKRLCKMFSRNLYTTSMGDDDMKSYLARFENRQEDSLLEESTADVQPLATITEEDSVLRSSSGGDKASTIAGKDSSTFSNDITTFNKDISIFDNDNSAFTNDIPAYGNEFSALNKNAPIFGQEVSTFNKDVPTFCKETSVFNKEDTSFASVDSTFSQDVSAFVQDVPILSKDGPTFADAVSTFNEESTTLDKDLPNVSENVTTFNNDFPAVSDVPAFCEVDSTFSKADPLLMESVPSYVEGSAVSQEFPIDSECASISQQAHSPSASQHSTVSQNGLTNVKGDQHTNQSDSSVAGGSATVGESPLSFRQALPIINKDVAAIQSPVSQSVAALFDSMMGTFPKADQSNSLPFQEPGAAENVHFSEASTSEAPVGNMDSNEFDADMDDFSFDPINEYSVSLDDDDEHVDDSLTEEQRDEHRWNKRSQNTLQLLSRELDEGGNVSFLNFCGDSCTRKQAASRFYTLLLLKKHQVVDVKQSVPFEDIFVSRGPAYASATIVR